MILTTTARPDETSADAKIATIDMIVTKIATWGSATGTRSGAGVLTAATDLAHQRMPVAHARLRMAVAHARRRMIVRAIEEGKDRYAKNKTI